MALVSDVVTGFVSESTNSLLKAVIARIGQEMKLVWGFKADLRDLEEKLEKLDDMLSGVQPGCFGNNRVLNRWMKRAREVAYQAEDVMDDYSYELLKRRIALEIQSESFARFKIKTGLFFSVSSNPVVFRFQMAHKVKSLKKSVNQIYVEAEKHGFKPAKVAGGKSYVYNNSADYNIDRRVSLQRQWPDNEMLIGRREDKDQIMTLLRKATNSSKHLSVVGVCGMAGLGKTALCKTIIDTTEVKEEFKERIWVCISHSFEFTQLLNHMVEQVGDKQPCNSSNIQAIVERLKEKMQGKKFLLVLDDVWETFGGHWEPLKVCLQDVGASKGNTVLVTSRIRNTLESMISSGPVHSNLDAPCIYHLGTLSEEDSWSLFTRCVGENNLLNSTKEDMGRTMLRKCKGVPLGIKVLGALLRSQNSISQWKQIEQDDDIWNKEDDHLPPILPSVKLSVKYLPSIQLKNCFAYCAIFKEDEDIEKDRLIQQWMAQGLLQPHGEKEQLCDEPLGEKYFRILLNYSLFQEARFDNLGNIQSCKMHDVVYNLALNISKGNAEIIECRSLHLEEGWLLKLSNGSIASFDITRKEEFITKTKRLRVLSLVRVGLEELPNLIGELKHLRYLDISGNMMKCLPIGLGKLYHLQTLRIFSNGGLRMPMLPNGFTKLASLRHLCSDLRMEIPVDLGMLTSLQTLPAIDLDNHSWGGRASELGNLHNLKGELQLVGFHDAGIIGELKKVKLEKKDKIEKLVLNFGHHFGVNEEDVNHMTMMEALQPHSNLAALEIVGYRSKALPNWMMEMIGHQDTPLQNLVSLIIWHCRVLEQLPSMKNLSSLKVLTIWDCGRATSLQNLEYLTSLQCLQLSWCSEMENLPDIRSLICLEDLTISSCIKMTCLPVGLSNLSNLKTLEIGPLSPNMRIFPFPNLNHLSPLSASLRNLDINAYEMDKVENLPNQIQHLRQLRSLGILWFRNLKELPEWLGKLTSLETLRLTDLPLVEHLPSQAAIECLSQLTTLRVSRCRLLQQSCHTRNGSEWMKIQKIHHVSF